MFGVRLAMVFIEEGKVEGLKYFYHELLGLPVHREYPPSWYEVDAGGARIAIHSIDDQQPPRQYLSFEVGDIDGLWNQLTTNGIACSEIKTPSRGRFFTVQDPAGTWLHFISFDTIWRAENRY